MGLESSAEGLEGCRSLAAGPTATALESSPALALQFLGSPNLMLEGKAQGFQIRKHDFTKFFVASKLLLVLLEFLKG